MQLLLEAKLMFFLSSRKPFLLQIPDPITNLATQEVTRVDAAKRLSAVPIGRRGLVSVQRRVEGGSGWRALKVTRCTPRCVCACVCVCVCGRVHLVMSEEAGFQNGS